MTSNPRLKFIKQVSSLSSVCTSVDPEVFWYNLSNNRWASQITTYWTTFLHLDKTTYKLWWPDPSPKPLFAVTHVRNFCPCSWSTPGMELCQLVAVVRVIQYQKCPCAPGSMWISWPGPGTFISLQRGWHHLVWWLLLPLLLVWPLLQSGNPVVHELCGITGRDCGLGMKNSCNSMENLSQAFGLRLCFRALFAWTATDKRIYSFIFFNVGILFCMSAVLHLLYNACADWCGWISCSFIPR